MVNKKILVIIIASVLIISLISYLVFTNLLNSKKGTAEGSIITSLFLESFPAGTQMGPGMKGTETTIFKIGEIADLSGTITTDGSVTSTIKIFDENGNLAAEQSCVEIKGTGGFGCGLILPQTAGKYTLKFYIEDTEARSLSFDVTN